MEWLEKQKATRRLRGDTTVLREEASEQCSLALCLSMRVYDSQVHGSGTLIQHCFRYVHEVLIA